MSIYKFAIGDNVIIKGDHGGKIVATDHFQEIPEYLVEAYFNTYSGWYSETDLQPAPINPVTALPDLSPSETDYISEQINSALTNLRQENQRLKETLNTAAGLLFRLEQHYFINAVDDADNYLVNQWRDIGRNVVNQARKLLNTQFNNAGNHE